MSFAPYRHLLADPAVRRLLLFGVLARVPHTAAGIVLTLHVVDGLGRGYAAAGTVAAAITVGMAVGAPWRGRRVDRLGLRRALAPSIVAEAVVWGTAPFVTYEWLLPLAFVGGLMGLPIFTVIRQSLSILVPEAQRRTAYAVDSMGVELSFMTGPALGVLVATLVSTPAALLLVGATTVVAGLALSWFNPPTRSDQLTSASEFAVRAAAVPATAVPAAAGPAVPAAAAPAALAAGSPTAPTPRDPAPLRAPATAPLRAPVNTPTGAPAWWRSPALLAVLAAASGATLVLAGTDVGVVAVLRAADADTMIGLVFVCWGAGSILGALYYGQVRRGVHPLWLLLALGVLTVPVGLASTPWLLCLAIVPAGALCAPVISSTAEAVARLVPERSRGAAMGWHGSALTVGGASGAPLAGAAIDAVGPWAGFALPGAVGALLAVAALALQRARRTAALAVT